MPSASELRPAAVVQLKMGRQNVLPVKLWVYACLTTALFIQVTNGGRHLYCH
jgi:hypothetical protein